MSTTTPQVRPERVWIFDPNHRVYQKDADGRHYGSPIWRRHWCEEAIVDETSRSWVTARGVKIPKRGADPRRVVFSEEEVNQRAYMEEHRYRIARQVERVVDYETLRQIAALVGYEEQAP